MKCHKFIIIFTKIRTAYDRGATAFAAASSFVQKLKRPKLLFASFGVLLILAIAAGITMFGSGRKSADQMKLKGLGVVATGLKPLYPANYTCSKLTSLYASWIDVDGSRRSEPHSGIDGGALGEPIYAPGPGTVVAAWHTNLGWGMEGSLLILHRRDDLNLESGPPFYYSEFDHLRLQDVDAFETGQDLERGEIIGHVKRPGNQSEYLPEVHWEVYEVTDPKKIEWITEDDDKTYFLNATAQLIDPLFMLAQHDGGPKDLLSRIEPPSVAEDEDSFKGFSYILPCRRKTPLPQEEE